jgi:hypothetical protein
MWALKTKDGILLPATIGDVKEDPFWKTFDYMSEEFRHDNWKQPDKSIAAMKKLGYKSVKVKLAEDK